MLPSLRDCFELHGPNGIHTSLVTEPGRVSVAEAREASFERVFQLPVARAIVAQLVDAVSLLHDFGIVHGDLHEGNMLLRLPVDLDTLSVDELYDKFGAPELEPVERLDGEPLGKTVPSQAVVPIWLGAASEEIPLSESLIILTDFSESFRPSDTSRYESHTPLILRPPEALCQRRAPLSFPSDIWSLGCTIFAILGQRPLFENWFPTAEKIMEEQVRMLGTSSDVQTGDKTEALGNALDEHFDFSIRRPRDEMAMGTIDEEEKAAILSMLTSMLALSPEQRRPLTEVLDCEWMTRWARPELAKIREKGNASQGQISPSSDSRNSHDKTQYKA
ncbi:hypothetical protein ANO11243_049660 [Dothideomycetidae sp. 11243]|nr:hypothetical protein ANO11243_049660 [fungal sp. No.11243]